MSELTDLLLQATSPIVALMLIVLFAIDVAQIKVFKEAWQQTDDRVARIEDNLIATDGGPKRDDE